MERTVTVVAATSGATADIRLTVDDTATIADVLPRLREVVTTSASRDLYATLRARPVDPTTPLRELVVDGDVLTLEHRPEPTPPRPLPPPPPIDAGVTVEVTAGPDAGRTLHLAPGRHCLGREDPLRSTDNRVSRRHVEVTVTGDGTVTVADAGSRNGTFLGGLAVGEPSLAADAAVKWPPGTPLRVGATWLVHGRRHERGAVMQVDAGVVVSPPPRLLEPTARQTVRFPRAPEPTRRGRLPLLASLAPLAAGLALALVLRRWEFAAFAVMSPLVVLGQALSDRWAARRADRAAAFAHSEATAAAHAELRAALEAESCSRHDQAPDLARVVAAATHRGALLWQRRDGDADALVLRLGLGELPTETAVEGGPAAPPLRDVPVCVDLRGTTTVGVRGDDEVATAVVRSLLVQLAVLHGPAVLQVVVLAPGRGSRWAWARWLPHLRTAGVTALATTTAQVRERLDELATAPGAPHTVVVADGVTDTSIAGTLATRPRTSVLWLASDDAPLPTGCTAVVDAAPDQRVRLHRADAAEVAVAPDLVDADVAEAVSRALAPLRDASSPATNSMPTVVRWSTVHDLDLGDAEAAASKLLRRWRSGPTTAVCIGVTRDGPARLDLSADGPHLLVAGTTGAGKSELLQTLVASLVAGNSPADLALLLVDFKGGAAFGPCARLPHTVALLTDLDAAATTRALTSLSAELRRRERRLAAAGVADYDGWRAAAGGDVTLPRLVIVVDEFATLADELPDFVGGLVAIAQRGRSLGVHLVLATQRPEGAVSADIRANTRLRVCLAVARDTESRDVIDSPHAVTISRSTPGRAFVRIGANELREVQTARVSAPWSPQVPPVRVLPLAAWAQRPAAPPATTDDTELDLLVATACRAATTAGHARVAAPWLPPLPAQAATAGLPPAAAGAVAVGLVDLPHDQQQPSLTVTRSGCEPLLVVGGARSGRTTAVVTVATALAAAIGPDDLHVFAIDSGRGLQPLADLPHTGAVVDVRDVDRVERLLAHLAAEVERRRDSLDTPGDIADEPQLLLVVDSWDGLVAATGDTDGGRCRETLLRLAATGASGSLRVVVTSDCAGLSGRLATAIADKICLRLPDHGDYALLGLTPRQVPTEIPPGRGIRTPDLAWVQLASVDRDTTVAARAWPGPLRPPRRFDPLPRRIPLHSVARGAGVVVGIRGDDLAPLVVDPHEAGVLLVAGPPGSGRSTTLVSMASQLHDRAVVAVCPRGGALRRRRDLALIADPTDPAALDEALTAVTGGAALLVDDVELLDDPRTLDVVERAVHGARDGAGFVVLAGTTDAMAAAFRGPVAQARRSRAGLLLRPEGPHDGEVLGLRLRRRSSAADPPGRGILALNGTAVPVQVPDPD